MTCLLRSTIVAFFLGVLLSPSPALPQTEPLPFAFSWYSEMASDVAVDPSGDVYVAGLYEDYIRRVTRDGHPVFQLETYRIDQGTEYNLFPDGIDTDEAGNLYVANTGPPGGNYLIKFTSGGNQVYARPMAAILNDVTVGSDGNLYVSSSHPSQVTAYSPDGTQLGAWSLVQDGRLTYGPLSADSEGHLYHLNLSARTLNKYSLDGTFLSVWALPGTPYDVDVAPTGNILIANTLGILVYSPDGMLLTQWGGRGSGEGELDSPRGVTMNSRGEVYVADEGNDRVVMFGARQAGDDPPPPPPPPPPTHRASIMLHIAAADAKPCTGPPSLDSIVTESGLPAGGKASYVVYLLGTPNTAEGADAGLSGMQLGIDYTPHVDAATGLRVLSWHHCATMEYAGDDWPAPGSGNTIVWGTPWCQRDEVVVAGSFYVTAYSTSVMSVVPWPNTGLVKVGNCNGAEEIPDQLLGLEQVGWVSFGGGALGADTDGCNPAVEDCRQRTAVRSVTWGRLKTTYR